MFAGSIGSVKSVTIARITEILHYIVIVGYLTGSLMMVLNWNVEGIDLQSLGLTICNYATNVMLVLLLEQFNHSILNGIFAILLIAASIGFYLYAYRWVPSCLFLLITVSNVIREKRIVKILLVLYLAFVLLIAVTCLTGITVNGVVNHDYATGYSLGFMHPNSVGAFLFVLATVLRFSVLREFNVRNNVIFVIVCVVFAVISWVVAACRTASILLIVLAAVAFILGALKGRPRSVIFHILIFVPLICMVFSVGFTLYCMRHEIPDANLVRRFTFAASYLNQEGFHLVGKYFEPAEVIDNGYLLIILRDGILWGVTLVGYLTYAMYRAVKSDRADYIAILSIFAIYGLMESIFQNPLYNVLLVFILSVRPSVPVYDDE